MASGDLRFNLAHSGELTLIAVTRDCEIGVDVELVRPIERSLEIASRNFHPAELVAIHAASEIDAPEAFLRCWTRKEAVLKAIGTGLGYPLDAFDVQPRSADTLQIELPADNGYSARSCWLRDEKPSNKYIAAVATTAATSETARFCFFA